MNAIHPVNIATIDLNLLTALDVLLETGSVSVAARRVGLSQPAMSHALARLRGLLGDPVLVRSGGAMLATPLAEELRLPLRRILDQTSGLLRLREFDPARSARRFTLMMSDYSGTLLFPPLMNRILERAPGASLHLCPWSREPEQLVARISACDAAITCHPPGSAQLQGQWLFRDRDAVALRKGNPLRGKVRDLQAFLDAPHIAVAVQDERDPVDAWLQEEGLSRRVAGSVSQYVQALHVVSESDFLAVIPERLILRFARPLGLEIRPLPLDGGAFDVMMLHGERNHRDGGSQWIRRQILESVQGLEDRLPGGPLPRQPAGRAKGIPHHV